MKNLIISLSLISTLLIGRSALAQEEVKSVVEPIETIMVVGTTDDASFEIFSLEIAKNTLESAMELMRNDFSASLVNSAALLVKSEVNISRAASVLSH